MMTHSVVAATLAILTPMVAVAAPPEEQQTAEQSFKNIQVLKGIPAEELIPAMTFMEGALGVQCSLCHETTGRYPQGYEKDELKAKRTAREMMKMTRQINDTSFQGRAVITCASCHNGHQRPQSAAPLATASVLKERLEDPAARPPTPQGKQTSAPAPLPAAEDLFAKYETAIGGEAAIAKLTSRHAVGTITSAAGQVSKVEAFYKSSGDLFLQQGKVGAFPVVAGFDGKRAYRASGPDVRPFDRSRCR